MNKLMKWFLKQNIREDKKPDKRLKKKLKNNKINQKLLKMMIMNHNHKLDFIVNNVYKKFNSQKKIIQ